MAYANVADLERFGVQAAALASLPLDVRQEAINGASKLADGYMRKRYAVPLCGRTPDDLRRQVSIIATYDLLVVRGYAPSAGADEQIRTRYEDAIMWLKDVARGEVELDVDDATPGTEEASPLVASDPIVGWGYPAGA